MGQQSFLPLERQQTAVFRAQGRLGLSSIGNGTIFRINGETVFLRGVQFQGSYTINPHEETLLTIYKENNMVAKCFGYTP
ncbi:hypothetical protein AMELA_G00089420 [Ameiurus melas]|uniref:Uncharacterized protein n=1 Tax=Ameiurus melas TaxID=219545 RepID=A0A7J6AZ82_AMEME|nr:hypothetical protein AMELA_G00089420 [Ameiurus melas]